MGVLEDFRSLVTQISSVEEVKQAVGTALKIGIDPLKVLDTLNEALNEVGGRYEAGEYFLSDLIMAGVLATEATSVLRPYLAKAGRRSLGKVVIGTVRGDIHDIGKNIVIMMLRAAGFDVVDLGVDVLAERFAEAIGVEDANVLGMSALLTSTMDEMRNVIDAIEKKGLRTRIKIVIGGRPLTRGFAEEIGADAYAKDAVEAIGVVKEILELREG